MTSKILMMEITSNEGKEIKNINLIFPPIFCDSRERWQCWSLRGSILSLAILLLLIYIQSVVHFEDAQIHQLRENDRYWSGCFLHLVGHNVMRHNEICIQHWGLEVLHKLPILVCHRHRCVYSTSEIRHAQNLQFDCCLTKAVGPLQQQANLF